jgi:hypothetical protein
MPAWEDAFRRYRDQTDQWLQAQIAQRLSGPYRQLARRLTKALERGGLPALLRVYDDLLRELRQERDGLLRDATGQARARAVEAFGYAVQRHYGTAFYRQLMAPPPGQTLPPVLERLGRGSPTAGTLALTGPQRRGYQFSDRFWRADQQTSQEMQVFLQRHVSTGAGAIRMAQEFSHFAADDPVLPVHMRRLERAAREALQGQPEARERFLTALRQARQEIDQRQAGPLGTQGFQRRTAQRLEQAVRQGSQQRLEEAIQMFIERRARYRATVVLRSEANRAFQETSMATYQQHDFVTAVKWHLSRSHKVPDECDLKAEADIGLGKGVYYKDKVPWPDHPNGLCYLTPVLVEPEQVATAKPPTAPPEADRIVEDLKGPLARRANRGEPLPELLEQVPQATPVPEVSPAVPGREVPLAQAEAALAALPAVSPTGRPNPSGTYVRADALFPVADETRRHAVDALERFKPTDLSWEEFTRQRGRVERVPLAQVVSTQDILKRADVLEKLQVSERPAEVEDKRRGAVWHSSERPILVRLPDGTLGIFDGHHRLAAEKLRGRPTAEVLVIDLQDLQATAARSGTARLTALQATIARLRRASLISQS